MGVTVIILAFVELVWIFQIRHKVLFTTTLLILAMKALNKFKSFAFVALFAMALQIVWAIIWSLGFAYSINGTHSTEILIILYIFGIIGQCKSVPTFVMCQCVA